LFPPIHTVSSAQATFFSGVKKKYRGVAGDLDFRFFAALPLGSSGALFFASLEHT
jgi:hypothetical protein